MNPDVGNEALGKLAKANLHFSLKLWDLISNQNIQLMQALQKNLTGCQQEIGGSARKAMESNDWMSMNLGWVSMPITMMKLQGWQMQQMFEFGNHVQQQMGTAMREAVSAWQKDAAQVMQESMASMPASLGLRGWGWPSASSAAPAAMRPGNSEASAPASQMTSSSTRVSFGTAWPGESQSSSIAPLP